MTASTPLILAIDTSTPTGSVALGRGDVLLAEIVLGPATRHSEVLLPAIEHALRLEGSAPGDLGGIVVAGGPGSFTGLRIAGATAKAMARALDVPLFAYSGLLALAAGVGVPGLAIAPLFDARRDQVYAACYRFDGDDLGTLAAPGGQSIEAVLDALLPHDPLFVGEGALVHAQRIAERGGKLASSAAARPRASALLWLAAHYPGLGYIEDLAAWQPDYMRDTSAVRSIPA